MGPDGIFSSPPGASQWCQDITISRQHGGDVSSDLGIRKTIVGGTVCCLSARPSSSSAGDAARSEHFAG